MQNPSGTARSVAPPTGTCPVTMDIFFTSVNRPASHPRNGNIVKDDTAATAPRRHRRELKISSDPTIKRVEPTRFLPHRSLYQQVFVSPMRKYIATLLVPLIALLLGAAVSDLPTDAPQKTAVNEDVGLIQQLFFLKKLKPDAERIGLLWKKGLPDQESKIKSAKRAAASIDGKLYMGYVQERSDVAEQFRRLVRKHDVDVLWIVENDGVVNGSTSKQYLIENSVERGVPLVAPTSEWVDAGAPLSFTKSDGKTQLVINEPAAKATGLEVPEKYESQTTAVAAAN